IGVTPINSFDAFHLKPDHEYQFRVTPRNRYGWGEPVTTSQPVVIGRSLQMPEFARILPGQLKALRGSNIRLECEVSGAPAPEVRWFRDGTALDLQRDPCPRWALSRAGPVCRLDIADVRDADSGRYMCEATNPQGRASSFARLQVVSDPKVWQAACKLR
ncbi:Protein turtle, partial [Gryllus bimaculatus]